MKKIITIILIFFGIQLDEIFLFNYKIIIINLFIKIFFKHFFLYIYINLPQWLRFIVNLLYGVQTLHLEKAMSHY